MTGAYLRIFEPASAVPLAISASPSLPLLASRSLRPLVCTGLHRFHWTKNRAARDRHANNMDMTRSRAEMDQPLGSVGPPALDPTVPDHYDVGLKGRDRFLHQKTNRQKFRVGQPQAPEVLAHGDVTGTSLQVGTIESPPTAVLYIRWIVTTTHSSGRFVTRSPRSAYRTPCIRCN
jgi:hypothetical protein